MKKGFLQLSDIFNYRVEIFGFSALMIVFHHLGNRGIPGSSVMPEVMKDIFSFVLLKANIGVDIFVFLSAIGLYYSMSKNSVKDFYLHRFSRVFVTWLVIMVPVFIYEDLVLSRGGIIGFLLDTTTLRYWFDHANTNTPWFVPFIIVLYLIYPILYKVDERTKHTGTIILLIFSVGFVVLGSLLPIQLFSDFSFCFSRVPIFLFGILIAGPIKNGKGISKITWILIMSGALVLYIIWFFIKLPQGIDMLYGSIVSVGLIAFYSFVKRNDRLKVSAKLFVFFGAVSLEMYLIHTVILRVVDKSDIPDLIFASLYILLPLTSVLLSRFYAFIVKRIPGLTAGWKKSAG